jgi:hypothetical protein
MTSDWAIIEEIKARDIERQNCGCKYNWDDHFTEYCQRHLTEMEAEAERWEALRGDNNEN